MKPKPETQHIWEEHVNGTMFINRPCVAICGALRSPENRIWLFRTLWDNQCITSPETICQTCANMLALNTLANLDI